MQQRSTAIESIESTISELGQIFSQLAHMVAEQRETVQRIDENIFDVADNVSGAQRELLKYYNSVSSNRWLMLKIFGVSVVKSQKRIAKREKEAGRAESSARSHHTHVTKLITVIADSHSSVTADSHRLLPPVHPGIVTRLRAHPPFSSLWRHGGTIVLIASVAPHILSICIISHVQVFAPWEARTATWCTAPRQSGMLIFTQDCKCMQRHKKRGRGSFIFEGFGSKIEQ